MAVPYTLVIGSATIGTSEVSLITGTTTLTASTTRNELEVWLDMSTLAAGDQFRIRVVDKVNAGTAVPVFEAFVTGAQAQLYRTPPLRVGEGWDVRVTKIAGTDRSIGWSLREDVGDVSGGALSAGAITAATFAAGAIDANALATDAAAEIAAAVWAAVSEAGETFGDAIRVIVARAAGMHSVSDGDGTYAWRNRANTKDRIAGTRSGGSVVITNRDGT